MIDWLEPRLRNLRRRLSRSEWAIRWLGLSKSERTEAEPGLLMIQIDGLSRRQFLNALERGNLPFLRRLLEKEHYVLHRHYSGIPSSTPAVQGELFYGVRQAVPAFQYVDRDSGRVMTMFLPESAKEVEERLAARGEGLLAGGSAYADIYSGGAAESRFCASTLGWGDLFRNANPLALLFLTLTNAFSLIRAGALMGVEFLLAVIDFFRGLIAGRDFFKELKFIPTRVLIVILMRELIAIGAKIDLARGMPIVHLNFLGFDEQAHRRGPTSRFAHWALKGIDRSIAHLWSAAHRSSRRRYDLWIYSDHGQEEVRAYSAETAKTIQEAVDEVFRDHSSRPAPRDPPQQRGIQSQRVRLLGHRFSPLSVLGEAPPAARATESGVMVTAMGPIGLIYPSSELSTQQIHALGRDLVRDAQIPTVLVAEGPDSARVFNAAGEFVLPADAEQVLGPGHPYLREVAADLVALCHHRDSGCFVISGWRTDGASLSFPVENGSHAGPGSEETDAFMLLPADAPLSSPPPDFLRPIDLRRAALRFLGRAEGEDSAARAPRAPLAPGRLRLMTYNVHSCLGMDGKLSLERIARIVALYEPDVVALQEVDVGRSRTGSVDQAAQIARLLAMSYHFYPSLQLEEEKYGDAILSRYPMKLIRAERLPGLEGRPDREPRGALWVEVDVAGAPLHLVNTHLGLHPRERLAQARALMDEQWLGPLGSDAPIVLCGDFNALPGSPTCGAIASRLRDAQAALSGHRPRPTWFGRAPLGRIDHVFVSPGIEILSAEVPTTVLTRVASDHLPLIVEMRLPASGETSP